MDDTFIDWNARGLAEKVTVGESADDTAPTARDSFRYGPDGARYFKKSEWKEQTTTGGMTTTVSKTSRKYYAGAYEKTATVGGDTVERVRIGDSVVHVKTTPAGMMASPSSAFEYAHRDHLGSVEAVTNEAGAELVVLGHDPYGERRDNDWTARLTKAEIETLLGAHGERVSRGFTGHEHLDRTGLIHMNGRMYDPRLGRFLSPDPIVGDPTSSQSWNLYSYVGNPLSYVDPTGLYAECDWVCEADMDAWWDWLNFLNSWWDHPHSGSDPYSASDYESPRSKAKKTLRALDQSVADEPADGSEPPPFEPHGPLNEPALDEGWSGILTDPLSWIGGGVGKVPTAARMAWGWIRGLFVRGVVRGYPHTVDDLLRNAITPGSTGVSLIARAIDKHAARAGSAYPPAVGNQAAKNAAAADLARDILINPQSTFTKTTKPRFGEVVDVIAPDGRGLRFGEGGRFIGLLEPKS